jgi:regulator of cell morphogenesis and NO signaling
MNQKIHLDASSPVGQVARFFPSTIAAFENFDVDYACKGGRSIADAAAATGLSTAKLLEEITVIADAEVPAPEPTVSELVHIIVTEHHRFEAEQFRILSAELMVRPDDLDVSRMRRLVADLSGSISVHMLREERNLFPRIEELDVHPHRVRSGSISRPLLNEFLEHDSVHERLTKLRELSLRARLSNAIEPDVLNDLELLNRAIHRHMHLENNVLIPRVIDLENRLKTLRNEAAV